MIGFGLGFSLGMQQVPAAAVTWDFTVTFPYADGLLEGNGTWTSDFAPGVSGWVIEDEHLEQDGTTNSPRARRTTPLTSGQLSAAWAFEFDTTYIHTASNFSYLEFSFGTLGDEHAFGFALDPSVAVTPNQMTVLAYPPNLDVFDSDPIAFTWNAPHTVRVTFDGVGTYKAYFDGVFVWERFTPDNEAITATALGVGSQYTGGAADTANWYVTEFRFRNT